VTPRALASALLLASIAAVAGTGAAVDVEVLRPDAAVPAHLIGRFEGLSALLRTAPGSYLALDRRAHGVFRIDADAGTMERLFEVGYWPGEVLRPSAIALRTGGIFAVLDAPNDYQRIQYFGEGGRLINGFYLPVEGRPQMVIGGTVVEGVGAMAFGDRTFLVAEPNWGSLFAELDTSGRVVSHIGELRRTGFESDPELHQALNTGSALFDPMGGYVFVFQTGIPLFRRYDADGTLLYERHVEGPELDPLILSLPTTWKREADDDDHPLVPVLVRATAIDDEGSLWMSLASGYTYVYDRQGHKTRVVRFEAAGPLTPTFLHFSSGGRLLVTPGGYEFATR